MKRLSAFFMVGVLGGIIGCDKVSTDIGNSSETKSKVAISAQGQGKIIFSDGTVFEVNGHNEFVLPQKYWPSSLPAFGQENVVGGLSINTSTHAYYDFLAPNSAITIAGRGISVALTLYDIGPLDADSPTDLRFEPKVRLTNWGGTGSWDQSSAVVEDCDNFLKYSPTTYKIASCIPCWYNGAFSAWTNYFPVLCDDKFDELKVFIVIPQLRGFAFVTFDKVQIHLNWANG